MNITKWLKSKITGHTTRTAIELTGYCPNCWGRQSYNQTFKDAVKDKQVDVKNKEATHAFIQSFVKTHLEPIKLQNHNIYDQCPICKAKYNQS